LNVRIAFVIYDDMTALDFVGVFDPVTRLKTMGFMPSLTWDICARTAEVRDGAGLCLKATRVGDVLAGYDLLVVPGGYGSRALVRDTAFVAWLRTARDCPLKASVCTGALLLGACGFLEGKRAATHPSARQELAAFCAAVSDERIVDEGEVITAGGVTAAIDLGLYLCAKLAGTDVSEAIRRQMDYRCD
jgi:transcriptional regulator GlxA family with amidase domain